MDEQRDMAVRVLYGTGSSWDGMWGQFCDEHADTIERGLCGDTSILLNYGELEWQRGEGEPALRVVVLLTPDEAAALRTCAASRYVTSDIDPVGATLWRRGWATRRPVGPLAPNSDLYTITPAGRAVSAVAITMSVPS